MNNLSKEQIFEKVETLVKDKCLKQKKNFENSNSYGFNQVSFLVINLITLMLAVVMINLLGK